MKPTTTPSAKAEASEAIGRSAMRPWSCSCSSLEGLAEFGERGLDLIGERLGTVFRAVEHLLAGGAQQACDVDLQRLQFFAHSVGVEHWIWFSIEWQSNLGPGGATAIDLRQGGETPGLCSL